MLTSLFTTPPHLHFRDVQAEKESPNRVNVKAEVGEQLFKIRGYQWSVVNCDPSEILSFCNGDL